MKTTKIEIPTYNPDAVLDYDYSKPYLLTLQEADGLRVVMGDPDDEDAPDVLIERAIDMWRVFVHPNRGDPLCVIEIRRERATIEDDRGETLLGRPLP
jgi:hypothetical protein